MKTQRTGFQSEARNVQRFFKAIGYLTHAEMCEARTPNQRVLGMVAAV
jgi:hypothetical protein